MMGFCNYPLYIKRGALELMLSHQVGHVSIGETLSQISFLICFLYKRILKEFPYSTKKSNQVMF